MLKDRRVLLEQEIARVFDEAAAKYLDIVVNDGDVVPSVLIASLKCSGTELGIQTTSVNKQTLGS